MNNASRVSIKLMPIKSCNALFTVKSNPENKDKLPPIKVVFNVDASKDILQN